MTKSSEKNKRPFVGMHYKCCNIYSRIYLNRSGTAFVGWCPKCARKVMLKVSPDGSDETMFTAGG